jgi:hypothetical protein
MTTTIIIYKQTQHTRVKYSCNKLKSHQKGGGLWIKIWKCWSHYH